MSEVLRRVEELPQLCTIPSSTHPVSYNLDIRPLLLNQRLTASLLFRPWPPAKMANEYTKSQHGSLSEIGWLINLMAANTDTTWFHF